MIVPGIVLTSGWWTTMGQARVSTTSVQVGPNGDTGSRTESGVVTLLPPPTPSTEMADRAGRSRSARVGLSLWALAAGTVSLPLATVLRVMAWGTGTAGSQEGSVTPQGEQTLESRAGTLGYDESGYYIGAGHPDYASQNW